MKTVKCYYCEEPIRQDHDGTWVSELDGSTCPGDPCNGDNFNGLHATQRELMESAGDWNEMPWDTWEEYRGEK